MQQIAQDNWNRLDKGKRPNICALRYGEAKAKRNNVIWWSNSVYSFLGQTIKPVQNTELTLLAQEEEEEQAQMCAEGWKGGCL